MMIEQGFSSLTQLTLSDECPNESGPVSPLTFGNTLNELIDRIQKMHTGINASEECADVSIPNVTTVETESIREPVDDTLTNDAESATDLIMYANLIPIQPITDAVPSFKTESLLTKTVTEPQEPQSNMTADSFANKVSIESHLIEMDTSEVQPLESQGKAQVPKPEDMPVEPDATMLKAKQSASNAMTDELNLMADNTLSKEILAQNAWDSIAKDSPIDDSVTPNQEKSSFHIKVDQQMVGTGGEKLTVTPAKHEAPVSQRLPEQAGHFSLAAHGQYKANLHLNHDDIGHIQAKIEVLDNQSSVTLITDNQDAKMMVQSQLSQLKSSFAEADLNLLQANVEEQSTADKQHKENNDHAHYELMPPSVSLESTPKMMKKQLINTLVDTYV